MAVSNPSKGTTINADLIKSWKTELDNWAKTSTTPKRIEKGDALSGIASDLSTLIGNAEIQSNNKAEASTINEVASNLFSKLVTDPILNYNADDKTALWADMPKSGSDVIYSVSAKSQLITAGDAILAIPNTIKNLQNIVKCYNLFTNAYGNNSNSAYSNGTDSNGINSNGGFSNGTNSVSCSNGSNSNGTQYVSNQSIKNTFASNPGKCTGYQCYNGTDTNGTKTNACSSGTCSSGANSHGVNTNSANKHGTCSQGTCTSGINSNQLNSNTNKSNGSHSSGTKTNYHAPITNSYTAYSETPYAYGSKSNTNKSNGKKNHGSNVQLYNSLGTNAHGVNTLCSPQTCTQNNKCGWDSCPNGEYSNGTCSSGLNSYGTCSSGNKSHGANSHGSCSCGYFTHGTCSSGQCQHGFKVNIRCNHTTNSNTST